MARLKISLILESGARIGPGKAALMESVRDTGSISAAARAMGMDYKRAWTLIDSLNRAFDTAVVERAAGGSGGGGATLTSFGADLLARYRRLEAGAVKLGATDLKALERRAVPDAGPKV
jgi:molybdate transport system regulatory protein